MPIHISSNAKSSAPEYWQVTKETTNGPFISAEPTTGDQRVGKKARRAGLLLLPISPFTVAASSRSFLMLSNPSLVELSTARENHPKLVSGYSDTAFEQN